VGRKAGFFFSGHLNVRTTPETGLPSMEKNHNKLKKTKKLAIYLRRGQPVHLSTFSPAGDILNPVHFGTLGPAKG
jgi:hypothetical protein